MSDEKKNLEYDESIQDQTDQEKDLNSPQIPPETDEDDLDSNDLKESKEQSPDLPQKIDEEAVEQPPELPEDIKAGEPDPVEQPDLAANEPETESEPDDKTPDKLERTGGIAKMKHFLSDWKVSAIAIVLAIIMVIVAISDYSSIAAKDGTIKDLQEQIEEKDEELAKKDEQIKELEGDIDELTNGPARMLEVVQSKFNDKDWEGTIKEADALHKKYPGTEADTKGQALKKDAQAEIDKAAEAKRKEEEKKKKEEEAKKAEEERKKAEKEAQGYETGITYDQLARYPDKYFGEKVKFYGRVLQVMNDGNTYQIRLAVDGNFDTVLLATFDKDVMKQGKILEDDMITVYGTSLGDYSYESVMGNKVTVPLLTVDKIDQ